MTKQRRPRDGALGARRRKPRRRPVPRWLRTRQLNAIARERCLMVLSVLSGEKAVTEVIGEAKISRPTYYQLETRALSAMLAALNPLAARSKSGSAATSRIEHLQAQVQRLEQDKRRSQRLLLLMRKAMRSPLLKLPRGRPPKGVLLGSIPNGAPRLRRSMAKASPSEASTSIRAGESAP